MITLAQSSQLEIYNMALGHVGVAPCVYTSESTSQGNACNQFWNAAIRDTLRAAPWDFATSVYSLVQSSYTIINNWAYAYVYPTDCLKIWKLYVPVGSSSIVGTFPSIYPGSQTVSLWNGYNLRPIKYNVRWDNSTGLRVILTNASQAIIEYSSGIIDPAQFDAAFVKAASLCLATYICTPLVNDDNKAASVGKLYANAISDAMRLNAEEGNTDENAEVSAFIDARGGSTISQRFMSSPSTSQ